MRIFSWSVLILLSLSLIMTTCAEDQAQWLHNHRFLSGSNGDLMLEKTTTRAEAAVMIVRLMGAESEAKSMSYSHPFTDVPNWAQSYVGYLYHQHLVSGISDTQYGPSVPINAQQYITMLLRALGYQESSGDFAYANALEYARSIQLISEADRNHYHDHTFLRQDMVAVTYNTLLTPSKEGSDFALTLYHRLLLSESDLQELGVPLNKETLNYRNGMRRLVIAISRYAKAQNSDFAIIPQNGTELLTVAGNATGQLVYPYIEAIDGIGQEDLFYGYEEDNEPTPINSTQYLQAFCNLGVTSDLKVLVTNYCWSNDKMDTAYEKSDQRGYLSFSAPERDLNAIPEYPRVPYQVNEMDITKLHEAQNFLYMINPENYDQRTDMIKDLQKTDYDILLIDLFDNDGNPLTAEDIQKLKRKANGGKRMVICYMSIGEAEDYRYYWDDQWLVHSPSWMDTENSDWEGNYKVEYWDTQWQSILFGSKNTYLQKILDAGFDGVYLDIIDAFEYFEES